MGVQHPGFGCFGQRHQLEGTKLSTGLLPVTACSVGIASTTWRRVMLAVSRPSADGCTPFACGVATALICGCGGGVTAGDGALLGLLMVTGVSGELRTSPPRRHLHLLAVRSSVARADVGRATDRSANTPP